MSKRQKFVYFFGNGKAEGRTDMKALLGGKGANLAEMTNIGIPVPPGFTITTEVCDLFYKLGRKYPAPLKSQVAAAVKKLEKAMGAGLGDPRNPLLVSVRSGAAVSMPGMMDTVLNLGLNDRVVAGIIASTGNARFAWDAYRRFINMFGDVVMGIDHHKFEAILDKHKKRARVELDTDLSADDLGKVVADYKKLYKKETGSPLSSDPMTHLWKSIDAVFGSWNNPRAIRYRQLNDIRGLIGTAVNVQAMVFGNMGDNCATGVCFTRDPATGKNEFYGEYLINAQGEDVVAGIRTPRPIKKLGRRMPKLYKELVAIKDQLEKHYTDVQDLEFTIQEGTLYILQTRAGKRTAHAAVKIAVDMVAEGLIDQKTAVTRVDPNQLDQLLHPTFKPGAKTPPVAKGLPASPGAAVGRVVFSADDAEAMVAKGEDVILVRIETSPEDIGGMHAARGILTSRGGMTSHAAVVARGMGRCCVAGCGDIKIDYAKHRFLVGGKTVKQGDTISLDGGAGEVMIGEVPTVQPKLSGPFGQIMKWADQYRTLKVRTNADTPHDARVARGFGAEGIGLCRTEHMFFEGDRITTMREMILADDETDRRKALKKLLPIQRKDFEGIFKAMNGLPVTIRLLDPPLHEFLPHDPSGQKEVARALGIKPSAVKAKVEALHEFNPMLGHRGCRLAVTYPEICQMQTQAIIEAACNCKKKRIKVLPEIMIPLVGIENEFTLLREVVVSVAAQTMKKEKVKVDYMVGTMIELPRAALVADRIAESAEFFSFGTNDLTQMTFGFSRDDVGKILTSYLSTGVLESDPFQILDQEGVGQLVRTGIEKGRSVRKDLKVGICGEHGGEPNSVAFCHSVGMNYVSCSPFRVPIARLAAARAAISCTCRKKKARKTS